MLPTSSIDGVEAAGVGQAEVERLGAGVGEAGGFEEAG